MKMNKLLLVMLVFYSAALTDASTGDDRKPAFHLIQNGKPVAGLVVGEKLNRVEQTAVDKFFAGLDRDAGTSLPIIHKMQGQTKGHVVIGIAGSNPVLDRIAKVHQLPLQELGEQDFLLRTLTDDDKQILLIAGGGPRGVLYGVREAIDQVITGTPDNDVYVTECDLKRSPAIGVRGTYCLNCWGGSPQYPLSGWEEAFDAMADAGMNRVMFWMDGLFRSQRHPDAFLGKPEQRYYQTPLTHENIHKLIDYAHDRGMDFYFASGVFGWFTAGEYIAKQFPDAKAHEASGLCPSSPTAQRVTLEYLSEMIDVFPEADGYMLEIRDELGECKCETCRKPLDDRGSRQFGQSELDFLDKLKSAVWKKHPKTKFIWLIGYKPHEEDVLYYDRIRKMAGDPRLEWLDVRNSWTLPVKGGGRKPLREFSDRMYHWDQYYRFSMEQIQGHARRTVEEGLNGFLPAYEPGFANYSIYSPASIEPFPVRLIPFCMTQFWYHTFTWEPNLPRREVVTRAHQKFFTAEVPRHMVEDMFFLKNFMAINMRVLTHMVGAGLGPRGCGLLCTVEDIWKVDRKGGIERKKKLFKWVGDDIRRFKDMVEGKGDMARLLKAKQLIAELRPRASRRSLATFDVIQRAIDDIQACIDQLDDYKEEYQLALEKIEKYLKELNKP